ncbi:MAG: FAD-dependent oxidoreductase [Clostridia bacterium]|nr:FAD-dependent oxidoreductase [Clostridia bacterium]
MKIDRFDVVVVGAGAAGVTAAISAGRAGASTLLVERYGSVGGGITSTYVRPFLGGVANRNLGHELVRDITALTDRLSTFESAKCVLTQKLAEAGVRVWLQTTLVDTEVTDGRITAITLMAPGGKRRVEGKIFIDASGDGNLSVMAGAEYDIGREGDRLIQPTSIMFTIEGIAPWQDLICEHEEDHQMMAPGEDFLELCHKACASGELPSNINIIRLYKTEQPGERMVNATQCNYLDPLDPDQVFEAEVLLRGQVKLIVDFLRRHVPGYENIHVNGSSSTLGIRESRRIMGDYLLCETDLFAGRKFPDAIVHNAGFCIDIHNPDGPGQAEHEEGRPPVEHPYDIPYAALRPRGFDNLLTAGRCISGTHMAMSSYRVMNICMAMGDAAGYAAAIAAKRNLTTREVPVAEVQEYVHITPEA